MPRWKKQIPEERVCAYCKSLFLPKQNHPKYRFCSSSCKSRLKNEESKLNGKAKLWKSKVDKEKIRIQQREYYHDPLKGRKEQIIEQNAIRRSMIYKSRLINPELTSFVFNEAKRLATLREEVTGFKWHVDHIVPVKSPLVCGLHIWNNFRVIPAALNLKKGNTYAIY